MIQPSSASVAEHIRVARVVEVLGEVRGEVVRQLGPE